MEIDWTTLLEWPESRRVPYRRKGGERLARQDGELAWPQRRLADGCACPPGPAVPTSSAAAAPVPIPTSTEPVRSYASTMPKWQIALIVIGCLAALIVVLVICCFLSILLRRSRRRPAGRGQPMHRPYSARGRQRSLPGHGSEGSLQHPTNPGSSRASQHSRGTRASRLVRAR